MYANPAQIRARSDDKQQDLAVLRGLADPDSEYWHTQANKVADACQDLITEQDWDALMCRLPDFASLSWLGITRGYRALEVALFVDQELSIEQMAAAFLSRDSSQSAQREE